YSLRRIRIREGLEPAQRAKTLCHEIAHAMLHERENNRERAELEAESTAYVVLDAFGLDSASYSFGYLASWGEGKQAVEHIKASGQRIQQTAHTILVALDVDGGGL